MKTTLNAFLNPVMDDLCTACLCGNRNLYYITETGHDQLYSRILNEIPVYDFSQVLVRVCWECKALLRRFELFKRQVKQSYSQLLKCVHENHKYALRKVSHLETQHIYSISYPQPIKLEDNLMVKNESDDETHYEPMTFVKDFQTPYCESEKVDLDEGDCISGDDVGVSEKESTVETDVVDVDEMPLKVRKRGKSKRKQKDNLDNDHQKEKSNSADSVEGELLKEFKGEIVEDLEVPDNARELEMLGDVGLLMSQETETAVPVDGGPGPIIKPARAKPSKEVLPERPQCLECGKQFSSRKTYRYHIEVLHRGKNRHPCPRCGKVYQWKSNLGRHMRTHTARDTDELYCKKCDKRFASVATYRQHLRNSRRHVSESDFNFVCNECGKKFVSKTQLRDHIDWDHLKTVKFRCELCNKPFKTYTSLYVHIQNVHRSKDTKDNLCHVCGKSYQNPAKLRYHIVAMHTSETPYQCEQCDASYGWYSSLYRHIKEVHQKIKIQSKRSKRHKKEAPPTPEPGPPPPQTGPASWVHLRAELLGGKKQDSLPALLAQPFVAPTLPHAAP